MGDTDAKKVYAEAIGAYNEAIKVHEEAQAAYALAGKAELDRAEEAFAKAYATFTEAKRVFATGGAVSVGVGQVMGQPKTELEVQGYAPDWPALEEHFPEIREMSSYKEKWAYIEQRCRESEEDTEFVKVHRPRLPNSHRLVKDKVVTDDYAEKIVDTNVDNSDGLKDFKYHDSGTGVGAEAASDSALGTPCGEARDIGSQEEGATTKTYKSIATNTYAGSFAITEHGLFNAAAAGILMDRTKFDPINVVSGNQIEFTFQIAYTSGG